MSSQPPFDPQDPFGVGGNLKEDELRTPERSSRSGSSFSPILLFPPLPLKYEGGAKEVPCINETNVSRESQPAERHVVRRHDVAGQCSGPFCHVPCPNLCHNCESKCSQSICSCRERRPSLAVFHGSCHSSSSHECPLSSLKK